MYKSSIATKFVFYLILFSILPLLAIGATSYWLSKQAITDQAVKFTRETVNHRRDILDLQLSQLENLILDISGVEEIVNAIRQDSGSVSTYTALATKARIGYILNGYLNLNGLVSIDIYTLDGARYHVGDTLDAETIREDVKNQLISDTIESGKFIYWAGVRPNINIQSPQKRVLSATSLFSEIDRETLQQKPLAILVANYSLDKFSETLKPSDNIPGSYFVVLDEHNRILHHPDPGRIGGIPSPRILSLVTGGGTMEGIAMEGREMVVTTSILNRNGWRIAEFVPLSALTEPASVIGSSTLAIMGICLLIIVAAAMRYNQKVVRPVRQVSAAFEAFEKGTLDPEEKLSAEGEDEIAELIQWHNAFLRVTQEQHTARQALSESETRFKDFAEASSDWLWETDAQHRITSVSDRFFETINIDRDRVIGRPRNDVATYLGEERPDDIWDRHQSDLSDHRPFRIIYPIRDDDGRTHYVRSSGKPHFDSAGEFVGYRGTGTDVSKEIEAERALVEVNKSLEKRVRKRTAALKSEKERAELANRTKTEFMNNMSHELRTPLNAIIGFSDVMKSGLFGEINNSRYRNYVNDIHASGTYLLQIISDILDVSRIEVGELQIEEEELDLAELIRSAQIMVEGRARDNGIDLQTEIPTNLPGLCADARRIKQILLNLLTNAIKFTGAGGTVMVRVLLDADNAMILEVRDSGIGIPEESRELVFEPFGKVEGSNVRAYEGIGLGLPIVRSLVEMHAGTIHLESEVDQGTCITIRFPPERTGESNVSYLFS